MNINIGVIGCEMSEELLRAYNTPKDNNAGWKILAMDHNTAGIVKAKYPNAEIVSNVKSILDDAAIELVFVSSHRKHLPVVREVLQAGKNVRII